MELAEGKISPPPHHSCCRPRSAHCILVTVHANTWWYIFIFSCQICINQASQNVVCTAMYSEANPPPPIRDQTAHPLPPHSFPDVFIQLSRLRGFLGALPLSPLGPTVTFYYSSLDKRRACQLCRFHFFQFQLSWMYRNKKSGLKNCIISFYFQLV